MYVSVEDKYVRYIKVTLQAAHIMLTYLQSIADNHKGDIEFLQRASDYGTH